MAMPINVAALTALWAALSLAVAGLGAQRPLPPTAAPPGPSPYAAAGVTFADVTAAAGLGSFRHVSGAPAKDYLVETTGSGCAFVDYDNDGWLDVYLVNGATLGVLRGEARAPRAALYRNNRDGTFSDVTDRAGVANERWGQGVCAGDFDNDGWQDLYVTNVGGNRLYRNNGDGTFVDVAEKAGVLVGQWSTGCAFGDYNGDGNLDLFVAGYVAFDVKNLPPPGSGTLAPGGASAGPASPGGVGATFVAGSSSCQYRGVRVMCGPLGLKGAPDHLFRNNGDGTFTEATAQAGVGDSAGYYGLGVAWVDYDDDGRLDLLVANDSTPNYLYRNKGNGTFADVSYESGAALSGNGLAQAHMGVAIGDYDGNGRPDIHITNFSDDSNVLYRNEGGNFTDVTFASGLGEPSIPFLGWGTNFFDYDHDGALDLLVANGHVFPVADAADWGTSYRQRLLLFRNVKSRFHEVGSSAGRALTVPRPARGSAVGDFDNDGDLDVLVNNIDDGPTLLRNEGAQKAGRWLSVRLLGAAGQKCPADATGTVVVCTAGGRAMRGEVASGRSYLSQSDLRVHFGLGQATKVDRLEVRWANGKPERYDVGGVDRFVTIRQGSGIVGG